MADISTYLTAIMKAVYGKDVRGSIHDAIDIINKVGEVVLTIGTDVTSPSSSVTGYYNNSLYLNTETSELWKCNGSAWVNKGSLRGIQGEPGVDGVNGNRWFRGTAVSGKSKAPAKFNFLQIDGKDVIVGDNYINTSSDPTEVGAIYHCTELVADGSLWEFDFTMVGGGGGGSVDIDGITITFNSEGEIQVATSITDKLSALDVTGKDADLFLSTDGSNGLKWVEAPNGTKRYMLGTIPVGDNVLGVWQEGEESTWNTADFVWDEGLYEDATKNEVISLNFYYDTKTNQPIYLAGYQWWNNETLKKGGLVVVVANEIESPVDIWVEVMRTVEV